MPMEPHSLLAWLALLLRIAHWLGILALLYGSAARALASLAAARPASARRTRLAARRPALARLAVGGLLAAALAAVAWPLCLAVAAFPAPGHWQALLTLAGQTAPAWFPPWPSLVTLQPPWPLAWKPEPDIPASSHALSQAAFAAVAGVAVLAPGLAALSRARWQAVGCALVAAGIGGMLALLPRPHLLLARATPASAWQPGMPLHAEAIQAGRHLYGRHCLSCHGAGGDGNGPQAREQRRWPTVLGPALFDHRTAGELFWHVRHDAGAGNAHDTPHAFAGALADADIWTILDYLRVNAAGIETRQAGGWQQALQAPSPGPLACANGRHRALHELHGRIVRIVAYDGSPAAEPVPDPLLFTIALAPESVTLDARPAAIDCLASSPAAWQAYALAAGLASASLAGTQFLVDRQGWLRSLSLPGESAGWTAPDSMCGPGQAPEPGSGSGAEAVLRRIDDTAVIPPRYRPTPNHVLLSHGARPGIAPSPSTEKETAS